MTDCPTSGLILSLRTTAPSEGLWADVDGMVAGEIGGSFEADLHDNLRMTDSEAAQVLEKSGLAFRRYRVREGHADEFATRLRTAFARFEDPTGFATLLAVEPERQATFDTVKGSNFSAGGEVQPYRRMMGVPLLHAQRARGGNRRIAVIDSGVDSARAALLNDYIDLCGGPALPGLGAAADDLGHGSAMVELIHAMAPDAQIDMLRIVDATDALPSVFTVQQALFMAAIDQSADIISMSFGFPALPRCPSCGGTGAARSFALEATIALLHAVRRPGPPLLVAATGNAGRSTGVSLPASFDQVVGVGSHDMAGDRSSFSNYAAGHVRANHVMAPGGQVRGPNVSESVGIWPDTGNFCYGTSVATAHASGFLAALWSLPEFSGLMAPAFWAEVESRFCQRAASQPPDIHGLGRLRYTRQVTAGRGATVEWLSDGVMIGDQFLPSD